MYLQSRIQRWLQVLRNAETLLGQGVQMIQYFAAHAHVPGARQISARDKRVTVMLPLDQLMLTLESQPLAPGSWLADALADVTAAMDNIDIMATGSPRAANQYCPPSGPRYQF